MSDYVNILDEVLEFAKTHECDDFSYSEENTIIGFAWGMEYHEAFGLVDAIFDLAKSLEDSDKELSDKVCGIADTLYEALGDCDWSEPDPLDCGGAPDWAYPEWD